jgi:CBS domain-containing protein
MASSGHQWETKEELLRVARDRALEDPVSIRIRHLLSLWGAQARGAVIVSRIRKELRDTGIRSDPDLASGYIDSSVRLVVADASTEPPSDVQEVSLTVGNLRAASQGVVAVRPDDPIEKAQTLMVLNDYSQLAVTSSSRSVHGIISWESIGRFGMAKSLACVRDATMPAEEVRLDDDLLPLLPRVAEAGYLLVRARDNCLSGVVTAADMTEEFDALASPFFLLGEIERRLRLVLSEKFASEELGKYRDPSDSTRPIEGADDLSFGEIVRLLERPDAWARLEWRADRGSVVTYFHAVRGVRNRLMHFSPDLPTSEEVAEMRHLLDFLKVVTP